MKTDLSHLPENKQNELQAIKNALIPRWVEIEMIILFGSYARGTWKEDKYKEAGTTYEYTSDYDLLIILGKNGQANSDSLTQSISSRLKELKLSVPVHPIFHGVEFVNNQLSEGNYFFGDIKKDGISLFTSNRYQLADKREMEPAETQAIAQRDFNNWFDSANNFLFLYSSAFEHGILKEAAFLLHQATERYYGAVQLVFTAYKPKTHDIEDMGYLAKACDVEFGKVFPQTQFEERQRFDLLRKAYVDARYNMDYTISEDDLTYLSERVKILRDLTEHICKQKIESFTK